MSGASGSYMAASEAGSDKGPEPDDCSITGAPRSWPRAGFADNRLVITWSLAHMPDQGQRGRDRDDADVDDNVVESQHH